MTSGPVFCVVKRERETITLLCNKNNYTIDHLAHVQIPLDFFLPFWIVCGVFWFLFVINIANVSMYVRVCVCVLKFEMEITTFTAAVSSTYSVSSIVQCTPLSLSLSPPPKNSCTCPRGSRSPTSMSFALMGNVWYLYKCI